MAFFTFQNKSVYYEEHGEGIPIVVLNGIMMSTASWAEFVEPFSANNRLILLDLLDQGRTDRMEGPFSQALQAELVLALLDHLELNQVCLLGISYGGEVALRFAIDHGDRLKRLLLFNTTARTGPWLGDIGDGWNLAAHDPDAYYLTTIPIIYSPKFYRENSAWMECRRQVLRPVFSDSRFVEAMIRLTNSAADYDVSGRLGEIKTPTMVVSCENDYLTPMAEQRYIAEHIPECEYVVIPDCGHASMYEKPVIFTALTLGFFHNTKEKFSIL